ncbi:MAG: toxic anion resistance protein [Mogibacterium sp.]|nr:toxic anion resistance protein [Mogibacterium sp.]
MEKVEIKAPELTFDDVLSDSAESAANVAEAIDSLDSALQQHAEETKVAVQEAAPPKDYVKDSLEQTNLTSEELRMVEAFVDKIDIENSQAIMNYGVSTQKKIADFSEKALENVKAKDLGEVGNMISSLVTELKHVDDEEEKGIFGFFKKKANNLETMKAKYSKIETNVNDIKTELEKRQVQLMKDSALLDRMYEMNMNYFKELTMYILAGKKKLDQVRQNELRELQEKAERTGLAEDAQAAKDLANQCERFEKKLHDLELTRTVSMQTAPQIRMVQASDNVMAEKIQSTIVNTIPLWKNQMVIAMGIEHSTQAAKAQREVTDMTNQLLKKNAEQLHTATVETAKESERGIIDMETLRYTNEQLITTLDEVLSIQTEGREKRRAAEAELAAIEDQLKAKLLEASRAQSNSVSSVAR